MALCAAGAYAAEPQQAVDPSRPTTATFTVFLRGAPIGSEQTSVARTATGWTITSTGRLGPPLDVVTRRLELRYTADWKPAEAIVDATVRGQPQMVHTTIFGTTASSEITAGGQSTTKTDTIDPGAILLPNPFFGAYEALTGRLLNAAAGTTIPVYVLPQASLAMQVGETSPETIQTAARVIQARRTHLATPTPTGPLDLELLSDESGRLLRLSVPAQNLDVTRDDIASVAARRVIVSRPNDEQVRIPANGFTMAGTISKPASPSEGRRPGVVLAGGSGPNDRDELVFGIPIFGQLSAALADAGFLVLRYDKRGVGQSGGRSESASLADFSEDQRAAIKFLSERRDVDPKRIAVVGHSEGGLVSLMSAAKDKRVAAVVLIATPGITGADLILAQQRHLLDRSNLADTDKQAKIELQKHINDAVISGKLDTLPTDIRRQVDSPEFQSILTADPARLVRDVRQPMLIVQGELDTQVDPSNADRLETLARGRKNASRVDVVRVPGVNHLLVPATTGEVDEYARLTDKQVSPAVAGAIGDWLKDVLR